MLSEGLKESWAQQNLHSCTQHHGFGFPLLMMTEHNLKFVKYIMQHASSEQGRTISM